MKVWRMLRYARRQATRSTHRQHKIGAIISKGGIVRSRGYNQIRRAAIGLSYSNYEESLHAERHACMQLPREELRGSDIYLWRELKDGSPASARPCGDCQRLLKDMGIKRAVYSTETFPFYAVERFK